MRAEIATPVDKNICYSLYQKYLEVYVSTKEFVKKVSTTKNKTAKTKTVKPVAKDATQTTVSQPKDITSPPVAPISTSITEDGDEETLTIEELRAAKNAKEVNEKYGANLTDEELKAVKKFKIHRY